MTNFVRIVLIWLCCGAAVLASIPGDITQNVAARTDNALIQNFSVDAFDELTNVNRTGTLTVSGATPAPETNVSVNGTTAQLYGDLTFAATNFSLADRDDTGQLIKWMATCRLGFHL